MASFSGDPKRRRLNFDSEEAHTPLKPRKDRTELSLPIGRGAVAPMGIAQQSVASLLEGRVRVTPPNDVSINIGPMLVDSSNTESALPARLWKVDKDSGMVYPPVDAQKASDPLDISAARNAILPQKGITSRLESLL